MPQETKLHGTADKPVLRKALKSQYRAAATMLREAVIRCPEELWTSNIHPNRFWQVAYHGFFYMHLYLQPSESDFKPWKKHREEYECLGRTPWPPHRPPKIDEPYSKADVLEYANFCIAMIGSAVDRLNLDQSDCGFWWYKMSKLEHQIVNIRHIQHHTAQLIDRLRAAGLEDFDWAGGGPVE